MNDYDNGGGGNEQRAIFAILLSLAVYWLWATYIAPPPPPVPTSEPGSEVASSGSASGAGDPTAGTSAPSTPSGDSPGSGEPAGEGSGTPGGVLAEPGSSPETGTAPTPDRPEERFDLVTEDWRGTWSTDGGVIRDLVVPDYTQPYEVTPIYTWIWRKVRGKAEGEWSAYVRTGEPVELLTDQARLAAAGGMRDGFEDGDYEPVEVHDDRAVFERVTPEGLKITKVYDAGSADYLGSLEVVFENTGSTDLEGPLWVGISDAATGSAGRYANVARPTAVVDESLESQDDVEDVLTTPERFDGPVSWLGIANRYFLTALVPERESWGSLVFSARDPEYAGAYYVAPHVTLAPGEVDRVSFRIYSGPKELDRLNALGNELDRAVRFGFFGFFSRILLWLLHVIHAGVANWGLAIIGLTFLVKALFFPLTQKAFRSSKEMQRLQPQLNELKEKYKDDKERQTQETMRLFREHGVNPMGGCLPTLIQLPVWFALYSVLLFSVDLYHSEFLVFQDLSEPDPYAVLPLFTGVLMFVQQLLTPMTGMDPTQAKIMRLMPLIFIFIIFSLPSGLALYISINSTLTIIQQWLINRNYRKETAPSS